MQPRTLLLFALIPALLPACYHHHDDDDDFVVVSSTFEAEPNDESASPNFLGVLRHGEALVVEGNARASNPFADPFDGFHIALTQPTEIEFALFFDDDDGELDVWIYDPAIDDIALFFESDFSPERGVFLVQAPVLDFQIVVHAFAGQSPYRLEVVARPIPHFSSAALPAAARGVAESPGFAPILRALPAAERGAARARFLGRPLPALAPAEDAGPARVGTLHAILPDEVLSLPLWAVEGAPPIAVLPE